MLPDRKTSWQTHKQTKPILAFFFSFPGNESVGGKDPRCLNDISNSGSGDWKGISIHRVSVILLLWTPLGPSGWKTDSGFSQAPLAKAPYALDLFYKTLMCIHLDPGCLNSCGGLTQDQHFEGKTELRGARKTPLNEQTLNAAFALCIRWRQSAAAAITLWFFSKALKLLQHIEHLFFQLPLGQY